MKKYTVEFIGTLFLVLTIGCCVLSAPGTGMIAPLAIGAMLIALVYAGGHISGAHYNPAVTLAVVLRGKATWTEATYYWIAQFLAAICAVGLICTLGLKAPEVVPEVRMFWPAVLAEFLYTFALAWVVLNVATTKSNNGNSFYGLAIGFTVLAGAFSVGSISGGAFNPAVAVAFGWLKISAWGDLPMYLVGDFAGGAAAAFAFKFCNEKNA